MLLRQCLLELRAKRHAGAPGDELWCESTPRTVEESSSRSHTDEKDSPAKGELTDEVLGVHRVRG